MPGVDLDAFRWLLTDEGQALLARAERGRPRRARSCTSRPSCGVRRRPTAVAAALTQVELRERAEPKFGELADRLYFTPDGLEQATRLSVATHRAGRYQAAAPRP